MPCRLTPQFGRAVERACGRWLAKGSDGSVAARAAYGVARHDTLGGRPHGRERAPRPEARRAGRRGDGCPPRYGIFLKMRDIVSGSTAVMSTSRSDLTIRSVAVL